MESYSFHISSKSESLKLGNCYTRAQWLLLATCLLGNFGCATCWSLQGPFYPAEAERKHIRPAVYGLVFGVYSLTEFLCAPVFGKYMGVIGPQFSANAGIMVAASCCVLFGFLSMVPSGFPFIFLSFLIRIVEASGDAAYTTGCVTLISKNFTPHIGAAFAALRAFYGFGLLTGPSVGGILYEFGGFMCPFMAMGLFLLSIAAVMRCVFHYQADIGLSILESRSRLSFLKLISIPSVLVCSLSITSASLSIGFLTATLEPHLRQFNLTPVEVGLCFVTSGAGLAITAVAWGWLSDGKLHPKLLTGVGAIQMVIVYLLIGPAPFIPMKPQLWLCIFAFGLHGLCLGAEVVVPFGDAMRQSVKNGFPNDVGTYGMVAGLWLSCFHLGGFLGPSIGGVLLDAVGFRDASVLVLTIQIIVAVLASAFYWHDRFHKPKSPELCESMLLSESCNFSTSSGASFTFPNITTTNYAGKFK